MKSRSVEEREKQLEVSAFQKKKNIPYQGYKSVLG